MIGTVLVAIPLLYIIYRVFGFIYSYFEYRRYKAQGVVFMDRDGFSVSRDIMTMKKSLDSDPYDYPWAQFQMNALGVSKIPPITGVIFPGLTTLSINSADFLDDIYVNQNKYHTKFWS